MTTEIITRRPTLSSSGEIRRAEILIAAADLFDEFGFHRTSTAAIADRVGTAKATIYHYFKAKHDILAAIHDEWIDELISRFEHRERETSDCIEQLHSVFRDLLQLIHSKPGQVRVFFEYFRELPEELQVEARIKRDHYQGLVELAVLQGMRDGRILGQSPRVATFAMFGMCNWTYHWYRQEGRLDHTEIADQLFEIFLSGVEARNP